MGKGSGVCVGVTGGGVGKGSEGKRLEGNVEVERLSGGLGGYLAGAVRVETRAGAARISAVVRADFVIHKMNGSLWRRLRP